MGCLLIFAVPLFGVAVATGRWFPLVVLSAIPLAAAFAGIGRLRRRRLADEFRRVSGALGKDLIIVYTSSPHWKDYIDERWLNRWSNRAIVLNRSDPWSKRDLSVRVWRAFAGSREHTPVAIVVPPRGKVEVFRFFLAFRDFKHGKDGALRAEETRLEAVLASIVRDAV